MFKVFLHKALSLITVLILVLPMSIQFAHALENHNHDVCNENSTQHFHSIDNECEFDHYVFKTNAHFEHIRAQLNEVQFIASHSYHKPTTPYLTSLFPTLSRGSPLAII